MFDIGFSELVLLAVVALVVLGPEKLPHAARMAGAWLGRLRRTVIGIQAEIEKEVAAQEMRERIQKEIERLKASGNLVDTELRGVENTIREAVAEPVAAPLPVSESLAPAPTAVPAENAEAEAPPSEKPASP